MSEMQGYSASTSDNRDEPEQRKTQVDMKIRDMHEAVAAIHDLVNIFENRLISVLVVDDSVENTPSTISEPRSPLVPIAEQLHNFNYQLSATTKRLRSILDRLEL